MILLPNEIIKNIIEYVDDPDIRRLFDVYNKINLSKYNILDCVSNFNIEKINYFRDSFYYLKKMDIKKYKNDNTYIKIQIKRHIKRHIYMLIFFFIFLDIFQNQSINYITFIINM